MAEVSVSRPVRWETQTRYLAPGFCQAQPWPPRGSWVSLFFFLIFCFLFEIRSYSREREKEMVREISHLLVPSLSGHNGQGWSDLKPKDKNFSGSPTWALGHPLLLSWDTSRALVASKRRISQLSQCAAPLYYLSYQFAACVLTFLKKELKHTVFQ